MLQRIIINNYALIETLEIEFHSGFNVITGETGAGKSIIIDAITLLLGQRGNKDNIRSGADKMTVQGEFDLSGQPEVTALLQEMDLPGSDDTLLLFRSIDTRGKNHCRVNGVIVTVAQLKRIGDLLVDIHSQHEHNSLFQIETHRDLLDAFGGVQAKSLRDALAKSASELKQLREKIKNADQDHKDTEHQKEMLIYAAEEINAAALCPGEDEALEQQKKIAANIEKLHRETSKACQILSGSDSSETAGVLSELSALAESVQRLAKIDGQFQEYCGMVDNALKELENVGNVLNRYLDSIEFEDAPLDQIENRLAQIDVLKRKYGGTVDAVLRYADDCTERLNALSDGDTALLQMKQAYMKLWDSYKSDAQALYGLRMEVTSKLAQRLENELKDLAMPKAKVEIDIEHNESRISATGQDHVEFLISLNPGVVPKPIRKVASGGEISRIMLALKSLFSRLDPVGTMIFDEIDTGISGRTAQVVAEKIAGLSCDHQIICITHLPQIAAMGDRQFRVVKNVDKAQTEVYFDTLSDVERAEELARMISGAEITQTTLESAREMIRQSTEIKQGEKS